MGGPLASAIVCLCSPGLSEHPWDSLTTLLALFQNKGRILERYTKFRGYLCGRLDGLLFLGNPGRILGEVRRARCVWGLSRRRKRFCVPCLSFRYVFIRHTVSQADLHTRAKGLLTPLSRWEPWMSVDETVETSLQHLLAERN